jgi:hypothetical protein
MPVDIDRIQADQMALNEAARQYMHGEITWEEWDAARDKYGPDYLAAFRHLDRVSRDAQRDTYSRTIPRPPKWLVIVAPILGIIIGYLLGGWI